MDNLEYGMPVKYLLELFPEYRYFWNLLKGSSARYAVRLALLSELEVLKASNPKLMKLVNKGG